MIGPFGVLLAVGLWLKSLDLPLLLASLFICVAVAVRLEHAVNTWAERWCGLDSNDEYGKSIDLVTHPSMLVCAVHSVKLATWYPVFGCAGGNARAPLAVSSS